MFKLVGIVIGSSRNVGNQTPSVFHVLHAVFSNGALVQTPVGAGLWKGK